MPDVRADTTGSWLDENQAYLCAEFARLRDRLSGTGQEKPEQSSELESRVVELRSAMPHASSTVAATPHSIQLRWDDLSASRPRAISASYSSRSFSCKVVMMVSW